jgi:DNA modification methylase
VQVVLIEPKNITVKEGLERYRKDLGAVKVLANSIKRIGQIQPILITREQELVVGGRRLAACSLLGIKIKCIYENSHSDFALRLLELEENLHRKDFSPGEKCLAIRDLHSMKQEEHGKSRSGQAGGWTLDDTAKIMGCSRGSIIEDIKNARMIDAFPELVDVKKKGDIKKAARGLEKLTKAIAGLKELKTVTEDDLIQYYFTDAITFMPTIKNASVDILLTDPLYGIEHETLIENNDHKLTFDDSTEKALLVYKFLAEESFRFTTDTAHGFIFLAPEHFTSIQQMFITAKWQAYVKPIIWFKPNTGQCNVPSHWPASSYEMILYIKKEKARIVKEGQPDHITLNSLVSGSTKDHIYEKPVPLLLNLLDRVSIPGGVLFDPFAGSCSSLIAGREKQLKVIGCDNSKEAFAIGTAKIKEYLKEKKGK